MELSFEAIQNWILRKRAEKHEILKLELQQLKEKRNYFNILKQPVTKYDRQIRRMEKKIRCHISID